jgi:uncharacterized protein YndB with AHSA1/START domain
MKFTRPIIFATIRAILCTGTMASLLIPVTAQSVIRKEQVMSLESATQPASTLDVVVTRVFDAPVEEVWKAWTDSEKVMRWWGPTGFTAPVARIDFRVGGKSLVCMRAPKDFGGQDFYNTWTYQKIKPYESIEMIFTFSDKDGNRIDPSSMGIPPGVPTDVLHVITFKRIGDRRTEMTVKESGYTNEQAVALSTAGLEQCLDKMARLFE